MDPLLARIKHVTDELHGIEMDLLRAARETGKAGQAHPILDEHETIVLISAFKVAVDNMRRFLWAYIEAASGGNGGDINYALQAARLNRVTELLRVLQDEPVTEGPGAEARGISDLVDSVMKKPRE